tara:strand:- start:24 stop:716 length:693 start_codon:yes stop_codon:yes gene_type:complete
MRLQDIVKYNKPLEGYVSALGENIMKSFKVNKDVSNHDFGITLSVAPDEIEQQMIEQNIQVSLAQKELRLEDAIMVRQIKNPKLANQMLILRREKYRKELEEQARAASEMNALQQSKSAEAASMMKQKDEALKARMSNDRLKLESQAAMARMEQEYKLKNVFEEANHKRKIEELKVQNTAKVAESASQSDSKKDSLEKNAHFQSKMIEQRKGREEPIEDPDLKIKSKYSN